MFGGAVLLSKLKVEPVTLQFLKNSSHTKDTAVTLYLYCKGILFNILK